jgi:RNA polymerase sigma-70 factor (ECF subfamily)
MDELEKQWLARARRGDTEAFGRLVSRYDRRLLAVARDLTGDWGDAQDAVQEALVAAFKALPGFRFESDFFTWLYRIAVNRARRCRRARRPWSPVAAETFVDPTAAADEPTLSAELECVLTRALAHLSGQERAAFVLCHRQGLSVAAAAAVLGCSEGSVKSYLFRARAKLRQLLGGYLES